MKTINEFENLFEYRDYLADELEKFNWEVTFTTSDVFFFDKLNKDKKIILSIVRYWSPENSNFIIGSFSGASRNEKLISDTELELILKISHYVKDWASKK